MNEFLDVSQAVFNNGQAFFLTFTILLSEMILQKGSLSEILC